MQKEQVQGEQAEGKFPYEKMLTMSEDQLKKAKFKYNRNMNQWVLEKLNGLNVTLWALAGPASNYTPHVNNYRVVIQKGLSGTSSIEVIFYDDKIYHKILTFAIDNGANMLETSSGKVTKVQFDYDKYSFTLDREIVGQAAVVSGRYSASTKDQSYGVFSFVIYTGEKPHSKWHIKEAAKQAKRDANGKKKQSASDLM